MAKKQFKKVLSMGLSLVMCASLTVPAFAASFQDLNNAINGSSDSGEGHSYYGRTEGSTTGGIEAWTDDNGVRNVKLHEEVKNSGSESSIEIGSGKNVTLDLNGNNINNDNKGNTTSTIWVNGGELTLDDTSTGDTVGKITGGTGSGVWVGDGNGKGTFTMNGGEISNNTSKNGSHGGGVHVNGKNASFTMNGGTITGNTAALQGGGVHVHEGTFTMKGGTISGNTAQWGGGVNTWNGTITMTGNSAISGNHAEKDGSDVWVKAAQNGSASFTMNGNSKINGSAATNNQHVVAVEGNSTFTMSGNASLSSDTAESHILAKNGSTVKYERNDDGGLDNISTDDQELAKSANPTEDVKLNVVIPDPTPTPTPTPTPVVPGDETGDGTVIEDPDVPLADEPEVEIDEPAVPLASGPITRAEFIDYLWRHEGEPASDGVCTFTDVPEDHVYVLALAWAEQNGVAEAYLNAPGHEDGTFEPDELVTVGAAREFLTNFENVFGRQAVAAASLKSLTGADDEAVLNCDEVLAEFFGEAYVPAKEDDVEIAA